MNEIHIKETLRQKVTKCYATKIKTNYSWPKIVFLCWIFKIKFCPGVVWDDSDESLSNGDGELKISIISSYDDEAIE